jgi:hypothetical protein
MLAALPHQVTKSKSIIRKLRLYGLCLFAGEVRSGKTAAFLLASQLLAEDFEVAVITKKDAIPGVKKFSSDIEVTNYHQAKKLDRPYKVVILDECHRYITGYPKRSQIWKDVARITLAADYIIFSSGTPTPESYAMLFNMLALSTDSPWKDYKRYTEWHQHYGIPYQIKIAGGMLVNQWDKVKEDKILRDIEHLIVSMTRAEAGHKFEPTDKLHKIPLTEQQEEIYKRIEEDKLFEMDDEYAIVCDTPSKYIQKLHQVAGGYVNAVNDNEESKVFKIESNKVQYIKDNFDPKETIILAFYIPEQEYLASIFPNVGSITKNSDGVDYSHFKNMVIYSMGFPASTYQQVIGRQLNFVTRKEEVIIHFLVSGIDQYVYNAVSNKESFTARWYKENNND